MVGETPPSGALPIAYRGKSATNGHRRGSPAAPSPVADRGSPRTPGSITAINDGRSLLANFRTNKRNREATPSPAATAAAAATASSFQSSSNGKGSSGPSTGKSTSDKDVVGNLDRFQPRAPGPVRNLEAALDASVPVGHPSQEEGGEGGVSDHGDRAGAENDGGEASGIRSRLDTSSPDGNAPEPSDADGGGGNDGVGASVATAAATAATTAATTAAEATVSVAAADGDAATAASRPPSSKKGDERNSTDSPARLTPEMVRQAARTSQAAFLSSVLPAEDLDFQTTASNGKAHSSHLSPPVSLNGGYWSRVDSAVPGQAGSTGEHRAGGAVTAPPGAMPSSSDAAESTTSDRQAVTRWASMRRLQEQSVGLGSAADHQLTRALQLCRDLRGLKTGIGAGNLSGHERASRLEALQSTLHGLQEVLSKRSLTDKAAKVEAEALGGPAVVASLLNGDVSNGGDATAEAAVGARFNGTKAERTNLASAWGWLNGSQLKAFEEQVQARSSMEISALQSERRKLRSKVEMFQRQVQLLQREGASHSPASANMSAGRMGGPVSVGEADNGGGFGAAAGEKRFADLLDARLGEERHLKATLEAELASLRGNLEEKDGLIGALREALRSAATPVDNGVVTPARDLTTTAPDAGRGVVAVTSSAPLSDDSAAATAAPAVPAKDTSASGSSDSSGGSKRGRGRYHSRSSRFLSAQGTVAATTTGVTAEGVAARHEAFGQRRGSWGGDSSGDGGDKARDDEPTGGGGDRSIFPNGGIHENGGVSATVVAGGTATAPDTSDTNAEMSSDFDSSFSNSDGGVNPAAANAVAPGTATLAAGVGNEGRSSGAYTGGASTKTTARRERNAYSDGRVGIISQATAVTGTALRMLWDSARLVGSRAAVDGGGGSDSPGKVPRQRDGSSHAVLIL
ncbi:unnamed protein product [Scytosiphon promiscuus]